jgi:hypothetical protein
MVIERSSLSLGCIITIAKQANNWPDVIFGPFVLEVQEKWVVKSNLRSCQLTKHPRKDGAQILQRLEAFCTFLGTAISFRNSMTDIDLNESEEMRV